MKISIKGPLSSSLAVEFIYVSLNVVLSDIESVVKLQLTNYEKFVFVATYVKRI